MKYSRILIAILTLATPVFSQRIVGFTAKIGVPTTDSFQTGSFQFLATGLHQGDSATRRYTAGAGVEFRFPHGFGTEFDILYKRLGYDLNSSNPTLPVIREHTWTTANDWEFPLLGVYRPPKILRASPRVSGGVSFRAANGTTTHGACYPLASQDASFCGTTAPTPLPPDTHLNARSSFGGTFGVGIEVPARPIRLVPEVRYTRWRTDSGATTPFDLRSNPNQVDFLLGITF